MLLRSIIISAITVFSLGAEELRIYSERHYDSDKTIFADFEKASGIKVKVVKAKADELLTRLQSEKAAPQADLFITKDAGSLERASKAGLLAPIGSDFIKSQVPEGLRGKNDTWTALTMRARVVVYAKDRVKEADLPKTYAELADPKYKGNILIRSSSSGYNRSLLSSIYYNEGKPAALKWAEGVKNNHARPPQGGDRDQIKALAKGLGDFAITNTYYLGIMEQSDNEEERNARAAVKVLFPISGDKGTHVNVSGAGVVKDSKNATNAKKFLEFILTNEAQTKYQDLTSEYAVVKGVEPNDLQKAWGELKPDTTSLHHFLDNYEEAIKLFDIVGWK